MGNVASVVSIQLLGPVAAEVGGRPVALGGPKQTAVLAVLALGGGRTVGVDRIAEAVWGEAPPATWMATVQVYVSALRKALGDDGPRALLAVRPGYQLDPALVTVDYSRFCTEVDGAAEQAGDQPEAAAEAYRAALALWRGEALADLGHLPGMAALAVGMEARRAAAWVACVELELGLGRHRELVPELEAAVAADPLDERGWLRLSVALARSGHQVAALRMLGKCRTAFRDELGLDASPAVAAVESAILGHRRIEAFPLLTLAVPPVRIAVPGGLDPVDLVGRGEELARVTGAFEATVEGRPPLVLLTGPAGIGKTRIAEELAALAGREGASVAWARCYEAEASAALRPVRAAFAELVAADPEAAEAAFDPTDPDVALLVPILDRMAGPPTRRVEGEEQLRLFDSSTAFLARLSEHRPLVLVVDDLQWLDPSSALLLDHLVRHLAGHRVLVVMTCRDEDMPTAGPVHELFTTMSRQRPVVALGLPALSEIDGRVMARALLGEDAALSSVLAVARRAEGVPFFVYELARQVLDDPAGSDALPPGVRSLVTRRIEGLPAVAAQLLTLLAVEPTGVPFEVLRSAAEIDEASVLDALDAGLRAGLLLERADDGDVTLHFSHALYASAVLAGTVEVRRRRHHVALAEAFAAAGVDRYRRQYAYHLWAAGRSGDPRRAALACTAAGDDAFARTAFLDAAADYERAIEALEWAGGDEGERGRLLLRAAEALHRAGDAGGRRAFAERAFEAAQVAGDADVMARSALVHGGARSTYGRPSPRTMELLTGALSALCGASADRGLLARVSARLAQEHYHVGDMDVARQMSAEALAIARATGDDAVIAATCEGRVWALYTPDDLVERLQLTDEMVERAQRADEPEWEMLARVWRCCALLELGDATAIDRDLDELARLADLVRVPSHLFRISTMRATRAMMRGDYPTGFMLAQETRDIGLPIEPENALQTFAAQVFNMLREQAGLAGATDLVEELARDYPGAPGWVCALAFVNAEAGRLHRTRELVASLADDGFAALHRDLAWVHGMAYLAESVAALGAAGHAATLHAMLAPFADRNAGVFDIASSGSVEHFLGLLAGTAGWDDQAVTHLRAAVQFNDHSGQRPAAARSRLELARALIRIGDPCREVAALTSAVTAAVDELGLARLATQLDELGSLAPSD